uniref:Uncharacterized protein n=1 Tax=viral metagenome TaxID=1070528 RepID=A0A6M3LPE5_9ZZZZ
MIYLSIVCIFIYNTTVENLETVKAGYNEACKGLKTYRQKLWRKIYEIFPEYEGCDIDLHWDEKDKELVVSAKKDSSH